MPKLQSWAGGSQGEIYPSLPILPSPASASHWPNPARSQGPGTEQDRDRGRGAGNAAAWAGDPSKADAVRALTTWSLALDQTQPRPIQGTAAPGTGPGQATPEGSPEPCSSLSFHPPLLKRVLQSLSNSEALKASRESHSELVNIFTHRICGSFQTDNRQSKPVTRRAEHPAQGCAAKARARITQQCTCKVNALPTSQRS